jgi:hypothetical protein
MLLRRAQVHGLAELTMVAEEPGPAQPPPGGGRVYLFICGGPGPLRFRVSFSTVGSVPVHNRQRTVRRRTFRRTYDYEKIMLKATRNTAHAVRFSRAGLGPRIRAARGWPGQSSPTDRAYTAYSHRDLGDVRQGVRSRACARARPGPIRPEGWGRYSFWIHTLSPPPEYIFELSAESGEALELHFCAVVWGISS